MTVDRALTAALLTDLELADKLGKKGSETDLTIFDHKKGNFVLSLIVPHRYPEKILPLLFALSGADAVVLSVRELSKPLGDAILAADAFNPPHAAVFLPGPVPAERVAPLLAGTCFENAPVFTTHFEVGDFLSDADRRPRPGKGTAVLVDQSFEVKGVGTVVLGKVAVGPVRVNQKLLTCPEGKEVSVRSIQIHDDDHPSAPAGVRVGLALRGAKVEDLPRGTVLWEGAAVRAASTVEGAFRANPFFKPAPAANQVLHVASGFGSSPGRVEAAGGGQLKIALEKPLAVVDGTPPVVAALDAPGSRFVGAFR